MANRVEDARAWLQAKAGFARAEALIRREARMLRVDALSETALKHALITFAAETGHKYPRMIHPHHQSWEPPAEQEEMF